MDVHIDALLALRGKLKEAGVTASVNDMVVAACGRALRAVPEANAFFDAAKGRVVRSPGVDVSVAVATEGGLITPIVKGADGLSLGAINEKVKDLAGRARANKLKPEEFQGGSFTISNLGMFDAIDEFSAVINPPQACILAVGKGERKLVLPPFASYADVAPGAPVPAAAAATVMTVQLSSDARVVDAGVAGAFLQSFKTYCENPALLTA
jgi:pyruvate dehydrogenase E2 component (dihydrolipoamide acetyltransferase)